MLRFEDSDQLPAFMDMRLGKSLLTIRWLKVRLRRRFSKRVLLVAPATPIIDWLDELALEGQLATVLSGPRRLRDAREIKRGWGVITYQSLLAMPAIAHLDWDAVVLDESTTIKNPKSQTTKLCLKSLARTPIRAVLSGLPNPENELELWTQMAFVNGGSWMGCRTYWQWQSKVAFKSYYKWELNPKKRVEIKARVHAEAIVLTRKQAGLGNVKTYVKRSGAMSKRAAQLTTKILRDWAVPGVDGEMLEAKYNLQIATWLRRLAGGTAPEGPVDCWKYKELVNLLQGEFKSEQVVVWFAFKAELRRVAQDLKEAGITRTWIHGDIPRPQRSVRIKRFRAGERRIILAQERCGRFGLNLSCADTEIYFSNTYSYEDRRQSEDRIEHMMKKRPLLVMDLITEGSADEEVMECLRDKKSSAAYFVSKIIYRRKSA